MFKSSKTLPSSKKDDEFSFDSIDAPKWVDFSNLDAESVGDDSWFEEKNSQSLPKELMESFGTEKVDIPRSSPKVRQTSFAKVIGESQRAVQPKLEAVPAQQPQQQEEKQEEQEEEQQQEQQEQQEEHQPQPEQLDPELESTEYEPVEEVEEQATEIHRENESVGEEGGKFAIKRKRKMNYTSDSGADGGEYLEGGDYYYSSDSYYEPTDYDTRPKKMRKQAPQPPGPLTNPQTPNLRTKVRGQMHEENFTRMVEREEEEFRKDQLFKAGEIKYYKSQQQGYQPDRVALTAPVTPQLATRVRGEMKESALAEKIRKEEEELNSYSFKAGEINYHNNSSHTHQQSALRLTEPVTPRLQTRARGEAKEQQLAEKIRKEEELQHVEPFKAGEINYHNNSSHHHQSAPLSLTEPVTPRLQTRMRGEAKEHQLAEKIRKEEEVNAPQQFKAGEIKHYKSQTRELPASRPLTEPITPNLRTRVRGGMRKPEDSTPMPNNYKQHQPIGPRGLTCPVTPNLQTRTRGNAKQNALADKIRRETEEEESERGFKAGGIRHYKAMGGGGVVRELTQPASPRLRTRARGGQRRPSELAREQQGTKKAGRKMVVRKERDLTQPQPFSFQTDRRTRANNADENVLKSEKKFASVSSSPLSSNRMRADNVSVKL